MTPDQHRMMEDLAGRMYNRNGSMRTNKRSVRNSKRLGLDLYGKPDNPLSIAELESLRGAAGETASTLKHLIQYISRGEARKSLPLPTKRDDTE